MQRACDCCGEPYEQKRPHGRFCGDACRVYFGKKGVRPQVAALSVPPAPQSLAEGRKVEPRLAAELQQLGVAETYEAGVVLGLASQLDSGVITGTAFVSLSKELDRRVDALRLRAERPDDPVAAVKERLAAKQAQLRLA